MTKTIVALYDDLAEARAAINNLTGKGFESDAISLVAYDPEGEYQAQLEQEPVVAETDAMVEGAGIGATLGGLVGLLAGLGAVVIPGVGPVVAGGALGAALLGTGAGMVTGGLAGALVGAGVEEDEAELYAEGVRRGGTLVVVQVPDDRAAGAESVLAAYNPADMERRGAHWREEGWTGYDPDAEPYMPTDVLREREYWLAERVGDNLVHMQAYDNYNAVFHRHYQNTFAVTEHPYERYEPAYRLGYRAATLPRYRARDWDEIEPKVRREWEAKNQGLWTEFEPAIRQAWKEVSRDYQSGDDYESFEPAYQQHYNRTYVGTGFPYERYQPAYRLGYEMALDERYWDEDWKKIEPEAQTVWEARHDDPWEDFQEAVHVGWKEARDALAEYDYENFDSVYRDHYDRTYVGTGFPYERYEPAYRLGYELAMEEEDEDRDWEEVEPQARREWESQENDAEEAWDEVKEAVKAGWDEVQDIFDEDED
jgi:hypothetical protein